MNSISNGGTTGVRNDQFDLISILYHALEAAATYEGYIRDAEQSGDNELRQFFQDVQSQSRNLAERAQGLLASRLSQTATR